MVKKNVSIIVMVVVKVGKVVIMVGADVECWCGPGGCGLLRHIQTLL